MQPNSKIYIAGHRGLVGSALMRRLTAAAASSPSPLAGEGRGEGENTTYTSYSGPRIQDSSLSCALS